MRMLRHESFKAGRDEAASDEVLVAVTGDELMVLANALNEALELIEDWEFATRLGMSPDEAKVVLAGLGEILRESSGSE